MDNSIESRDRTPRQWPQCEGVLDDLSRAVGRSSWVARLRRYGRRLGRSLAPQGVVNVQLAPGQALSLEGSREARLECLAGTVWATGDGLDCMLPHGAALAYPEGGRLVVSAVGGAAKVRLGWR